MAGAEVLRTVGNRVTCDEAGVATFPRVEGVLRWMASDGTRWGARELPSDAADRVPIAIWAQQTVDVNVVDRDGKGIAGVPVAVGSRPWLEHRLVRSRSPDEGSAPRAASIDTAWPAGFAGVVATVAPEGLARFPHAEGWREPNESIAVVATLGFPVFERQDLVLTGTLAGVRRQLQLPPTGRVVLRFEGVELGVVQLRLRVAPLDRPHWRDFEPARAAPVAGTLEGPRRDGETVEFEAQGEATLPRLVGRIVDEDGSVVAAREVEFHVNQWWSDQHGGRYENTGWTLTTGPDGSFDFNVDGDILVATTRLLTIGEPRRHDCNESGARGAMFDLTAPMKLGRTDLGRVVLYRPGSLAHVRRLSDDEIERVYLVARGGCGFSGDPQHDADNCLTVMAERRGASWRSPLATGSK